jgi:26S proteasome regulatory subunit N10
MEATIICVDNSEWARNGDYSPNRWESQQEAVNTIANLKTSQNPDNSVGILSMAGARSEVVVSPTNDMGKILQAIYDIKVQGQTDFSSALQIAQLALKHRPKKEQRQRIIAFVCSPVRQEAEKFAAVGRTLKRNNIALDIVCFGNLEDIEKLQDLQRLVNAGDNSHFVSVPPGLGILCDALRNTPILHGGAGQSFEEHGGIDPTLDPELATAIRLSLEEQKKRQEDEGKANPEPAAPVEDEEEKLLQEAIRLSMMETEEKKEDKAEEKEGEGKEGFINQDFMKELLGSVEGVDIQDPKLQEMLNMAKKETGEKEEKEEQEKGEKKEDREG